MSNMKKHIGCVANTAARCVVVFMQIPNRESHALIAQIDNLPPRFEQALMEVVESNEAQAETSLASILARRLMPENGRTILETLHTQGYLTAVAVDNVLMLPVPNMPFPLRQVIEAMGGTVPEESLVVPVPQIPEPPKYNPYAQTKNNEVSDAARGTAQNLLVEAEMLETDARRKREQAYNIVPDLRPQTVAIAIAPAATSVETVTKTAKPRASRKKTPAS